MATGTARIAVVKRRGHVTSDFPMNRLVMEIPGPIGIIKLRTTCRPAALNLLGHRGPVP